MDANTYNDKMESLLNDRISEKNEDYKTDEETKIQHIKEILEGTDKKNVKILRISS